MRNLKNMLVDSKMQKIVSSSLDEALAAKTKLRQNPEGILKIAEQFVKTLKRGGTIFLFGNGGSAADAQHIAAELVGRFDLERRSLPAIALTVNTSNLTAIGNDYGYDFVFSRQIEGLAKKGDLAVAISTSGNSPNVLEAVKAAKAKGVYTIGLTGEKGGKLKDAVDFCFHAASNTPSRIQEVHITVGHIACALAEAALFESDGKLAH